MFSPTAVKMVVGDHHSLYLDAMGFPYGLGNNHYGEIGSVVNAISIPTRIINEQVAGIATSTMTSLILKKDGSLWGIGHLQYAGFGFPKNPVKITEVQLRILPQGRVPSMWFDQMDLFGLLVTIRMLIRRRNNCQPVLFG